MSNVDSVGDSSALDGMRWQNDPAAQGSSNSTLTQEDFFALMTQQLSYQDPFEPVDNQQMVDQMTSYSTLDAIKNLSDQFSSLTEQMTSNQALQASSLVGRDVLVPVEDMETDVEGQSVSGRLNLTSEETKDAVVRVMDKSGQVIKTIELGDLEAGEGKFTWDGTDDEGNKMPPGEYSFEATGLIDGKTEAISLGLFATVESVSLSSTYGPVVNLPHIGPVTMDNIYEIRG